MIAKWPRSTIRLQFNLMHCSILLLSSADLSFLFHRNPILLKITQKLLITYSIIQTHPSSREMSDNPMKVGGRRINSKKVKMNWTLNQKIKLPVDLKLDNDGELVEIEGAYVPELVSELEKQLKDAFQRADVSQDVLIREFVAEGKHDLVAACKEAFDAYRSLMNEKAANFKNEWITSLYKQYKDSLPKPISVSQNAFIIFVSLGCRSR